MSSRRIPSTVYYLHGFASSPASTKAQFFAGRFHRHGIPLVAPDFNLPDFSTLTISRMLDQLTRALESERAPVPLIGSSLGAALAVLAATRLPWAVDRLILLAPAVMVAKPGHSLIPPERVAEWKHRGSLPFFHHAYGEERVLGYAFYADSLHHDVFEMAFDQPTLVFQGLKDAVVDHRAVERFAASRPNVTLSLLDDDHQLASSLPTIWSATEDFLGLLE